MSACISRAGEYSEHTTSEGNYICDRCGVLDEDGLFAERDALRAEVERRDQDARDQRARAVTEAIRADAAEAKVARVSALAGEWDATTNPVLHVASSRLWAALRRRP